jgi:hypothetical protein
MNDSTQGTFDSEKHPHQPSYTMMLFQPRCVLVATTISLLCCVEMSPVLVA